MDDASVVLNETVYQVQLDEDEADQSEHEVDQSEHEVENLPSSQAEALVEVPEKPQEEDTENENTVNIALHITTLSRKEEPSKNEIRERIAEALVEVPEKPQEEDEKNVNIALHKKEEPSKYEIRERIAEALVEVPEKPQEEDTNNEKTVNIALHRKEEPSKHEIRERIASHLRASGMKIPKYMNMVAEQVPVKVRDHALEHITMVAEQVPEKVPDHALEYINLLKGQLPLKVTDNAFKHMNMLKQPVSEKIRDHTLGLEAKKDMVGAPQHLQNKPISERQSKFQYLDDRVTKLETLLSDAEERQREEEERLIIENLKVQIKEKGKEIEKLQGEKQTLIVHLANIRTSMEKRILKQKEDQMATIRMLMKRIQGQDILIDESFMPCTDDEPPNKKLKGEAEVNDKSISITGMFPNQLNTQVIEICEDQPTEDNYAVQPVINEEYMKQVRIIEQLGKVLITGRGRESLENLATILDDFGIQPVDTSTKGNCLFEAIAQQTTMDHVVLRAKVCQYMRDAKEVLQDTFAPTLISLGMNYDEYVNRMGKYGQWGDSLVIYTASLLLNRNVTVVGPEMYFSVMEDKETDIIVLYNGDNHYVGTKRRMKNQEDQSKVPSPENKINKTSTPVKGNINFCKVCDKGFANFRNYQAHMDSHTQSFPHICDICGKGYSRKDIFKQHMLTHSDVRQYKCEKCDKAFKTQDVLRKHSKSHESPTISCTKCGKIFQSKHNLGRHLKGCHK